MQHSLQPRDLRKIDTKYINQLPAILVRKEAILVNLLHIRALIKADLVVLFDSVGSTDSYNQSIFVYDLQEKLRMGFAAAGGLPFEFRALEAIFISVISTLQAEMEVLVNLVSKLLTDLEENIDREKLKLLLQYSKKLSKFEQKTLMIRNAIVDVLDQDEDLAAMYLTEKAKNKPRAMDQHEEIELLLESYLKQTEEIANTVATLSANMRSTEEIANIILDANRNALLLLELKLTMGTLGVGTGAMIASLFGMNLKNFLEDDVNAFAAISGLACGLSATVFVYCLRKMNTLRKLDKI
ncbi:10268_t:CDS:2 [Paraglomus occultum]|uniref:Magnesium transporter n=1 Tax=Paraglomus occultum TaxID=144539 RepID=A0A9N9B0W6_9GLOM|nr:10268_t:CDS:2 [Paraglomus occultum]